MRESFLFLMYKLFKKDQRFLFYRELLAHLKWDRETVLEHQKTALTNLIQHAYSNTTYYKALFDELGLQPSDIQTQEDLKKIPILTKQTIKDNLLRLSTNDHFGKNMIKCTSGGSTGEQALIYRSKYFNEISRASWLRNNAMIGWYPIDKSVWFWPSRTEYGNLERQIRARVGGFVNRRIFFNAYNYSQKDFRDWQKRMVRFGPKVVYGYASFILEFAKFLLKENLKVPSVAIVVTTAEQLKEREVIKEAFDCPVHNQYGCGEVVAIGMEIDEDDMVCTDDIVLVNRNEENQFLLTPLYSFGFPLINYRVADVGTPLGTNGVHSKVPFPKFNLNIGRMSDSFLRKDATKLSTVAFSGYLSTQNLGIKQHQMIQVDYTSFVINYVSLSGMNHNSYRVKIESSLEKHFGKNLNLEFNDVLEIPLESSGKRLLFKRTFQLDI